MTSSSPEGLQTLLEQVGVREALPEFAEADVINNPIDIHLSALADVLVQSTGCEANVAYESIASASGEWDLVAVVPRLRLNGDTREIAQAIGNQVRHL